MNDAEFFAELEKRLSKVEPFLNRLLAYLPVILDDIDYDYGACLILLRFKLSRLKDHISEHQMHDRWEKDVKGIQHAMDLLDKYEKDDDDKVWNELFNHLKKEMRHWWC